MYPALSIGDFALLDAAGDVLAFERRHGAERLIVALNLGGGRNACSCRTGRVIAGLSCPLSPTRRRPETVPCCYGETRAWFLRWIDKKQGRTIVLRIAMLAPTSWRTPPRHYGPWELVTSLLTEALVARGVDVTLFATKDSWTAGTLAGVCPAPYSEDPAIDAKTWGDAPCRPCLRARG